MLFLSVCHANDGRTSRSGVGQPARSVCAPSCPLMPARHDFDGLTNTAQPAAAQAGTAPGEDLNSAALYHSLKPASPPTPEDDDMDIAQDSPTHNVAATKPGTTALSGAAAVAAAAAAAAPAALAAAARDAPKTIPAATLPPVPQVQAGCLDGAEASGATRRALVPPSVPRQASPTYVPRPVVRDASKRDGPMISTETSDFLAKIAAKRRAEGHIVEVVGAVASASNPAPERALQDSFGAGGGPACRGPDAWGAEGRRDSWGWERGRDPAPRDTLQGMRGHGQEDSGDRHGVAGADRNTCSARQSNFSDGPPPQFCAAELGHVARESVPTDGYHAEYQHAGGFTGGNQLPPSHSAENAGGGAWGLNGFDIRTDTGVGGHPATATQLGANPQIEAVTEAEAFYPGGGAFDDADGLDVDDENSQGVARLKRYVIAAVKETIQVRATVSCEPVLSWSAGMHTRGIGSVPRHDSSPRSGRLPCRSKPDLKVRCFLWCVGHSPTMQRRR